MIRHESGSPERCPQCGSYAIDVGFNPDLLPRPYVSECEKCGWLSVAVTNIVGGFLGAERKFLCEKYGQIFYVPPFPSKPGPSKHSLQGLNHIRQTTRLRSLSGEAALYMPTDQAATKKVLEAMFYELFC